MKKKLDSLLFGLFIFLVINLTIILHAWDSFFREDADEAEKALITVVVVVITVISLIFLL
jgi:hypothetical protein